ncbi:cytoskeletal protein binding protein [Tulasnella sp. 427]|nr:cytoskeletal protein binding protein [Tulasnella sp. 427]
MSSEPTNTRTWRDCSGRFEVEAQFLGIHNNKVRLHKANGVIIEVPEEKMSGADMDYIRKLGRNPTSPRSPTGNDDDVPLGTLSKNRPQSTQGSSRQQPPLRKSHIDWFEFFLNSGCDIDDCTRYATSFEREKIDEAILPDLKNDTLRGLGLREGDVIRVMKQIEQRGWKVEQPRSADPKVQDQMKKDAEMAARLQEEEYGRKAPGRSNTASPGLFTGPGGTLKNNTRRGRPAPTKAATLTVDASGLAGASEQLSRTSTPSIVSSPKTTTATTSKPAATSSASVVGGFDDDAWTPRPASAASKPAPTPISAPPPVATPTPPPPPPPAPPVQAVAAQSPAQPAPQAVAPQPPAAPKLASEFDVLAKIGTMRPPSAPAQPTTAPMAPTISPPPAGFQQGMGMGASPASMGSFLQAQATGALSPLHSLGGPRAPFAPVPQNEGLLKPLIPTTTGFNSFVPTRPGTAPATSLPGTTPSFLATQPTGFNHPFNAVPQQSISPLLPNPTGFAPSPSPLFQPPSATSSGFSTSSFTSANSTLSPLAGQPTGYGNFGPGNGFAPQFGGANPGSNFLNSVSSQPTGMYNAPPNVNPPPDNNSPANVFAAMKTGAFANASAPQSSDRYDALRPQPTGWNGLNAGIPSQPTGFNPGFGAGSQLGATFGQPAGFQQPMQTGFGQPGFGGTQNQFGGYQPR